MGEHAGMTRAFEATATRTSAGPLVVPIPFEPAEAWGVRERYHLAGTLQGSRFRTALVQKDGAWVLSFGPKSGCSAGVASGEQVAIEVWPEGPQTDELALDIVAALAARPKARDKFTGLATFYRKGWLRWIDATKRRPEVRAARIAEMIELVEAGHKQRP